MKLQEVSIALPVDLIAAIDRAGQDRSDFVQQAIEHELAMQRSAARQESLENPHPESAQLETLGWDDWGREHRTEDQDLLDPECGVDIEWSPEAGWQEPPR